MLPQRERTSKARPTTAYFEKLGQSLAEMKRVLRPEGSIALVVSKEHTFYEMVTRKVLRTFDMVEAISQLATEAVRKHHFIAMVRRTEEMWRRLLS